MVQIAFYKGEGDKFDKLIRWWTNSKYSHCEIIISKLWYSSSPRDLKVRGIEIDYNPNHWDIIKVPASVDQRKEIIAFFVSQLGKKYDWLGIILSQILPLGINNPKKWFCSEICSEALMGVDLIPKTQKSSWYSPQRLYNAINNT